MTPEWVPHAIFYTLNADRFAVGSQPSEPDWDGAAFEAWDAPPVHKAYKGGNLYGVIERLDYLQDLGINALYLTPIFTSPTHHRYKTISYYDVDPLLGGNAAFDALRKETQRRGIRLVLDGVFNHVGVGFPRFQDLLEYGPASPWRRWFHAENWPEYTCWHNNRSMPVLNYSNPHVREYILRVAEYWVQRGIDGWRLDAPTRIDAPGFWQEMRQRLTRINPDVYLVGEVWTSASQWLDGTQWHGVTNYPLLGAIHRYVAAEKLRSEHLLPGSPPFVPLNAAGFEAEYRGLLRQYSWDAQLCMLNFLGTHDTARFRSLCGEDEPTVKLATALLMALPGAPCIYYGDEVGMRGGVPPASRGGFPAGRKWDQGVLQYHRELIRLRRAHPVLRKGTVNVTAADNSVLIIDRKDENSTMKILVNTAGTPVILENRGLKHCVHGDSQAADGRIVVAARSAAFWEH